MLCCSGHLRHRSYGHRKRGGLFVVCVVFCFFVVFFFFYKLNLLYLNLFSGKIYLVFGGFKKAEYFLTLGCLCPCSNES